MDLRICGLIDIILILLILLVLFLGYKKGFLKKAIGLIGLFVGLAIAFVFCTQLPNSFTSCTPSINTLPNVPTPDTPQKEW